uniref:Uncharacterized protein n=1 Tax=Arundo donax TaxID=35708 RepID=A0A0A8YAU1_ARUDO
MKYLDAPIKLSRTNKPRHVPHLGDFH